MIFTIIPPEYTGESEYQHPGNITDIPLPERSRIRITGQASKILESTWVMLDDRRHDLFIQEDRFTGTILIHDENTAVIFVEDKNGVINLDNEPGTTGVINEVFQNNLDVIVQNFGQIQDFPEIRVSGKTSISKISRNSMFKSY